MIKKLYLTSALLCSCTSVMASWYVGGGIGTVDYGAENISTFDDPTGFELIIGSEINSNLSLEASFIDFGEADDGIFPNWQINADGLTFGALIKAPVNRDVDVFLKVGLNMWDVKYTEDGFGLFFEDDGTGLFYGIGATIKLNNEVSLGARYNSYDFDYDLGTDNVTMFSVNVFVGF